MSESTTQEISKKMEEVRSDLGDNVEELVDSARMLSDWRHYVSSFPWACMAGAAALGFSLVPKRVELVSPDADALEELAKRNKLVVKSNPKPQAKSGITGAVFSLLANAAMRSAMAYAGQNVGKLLGTSAAEDGEANGEEQ